MATPQIEAEQAEKSIQELPSSDPVIEEKLPGAATQESELVLHDEAEEEEEKGVAKEDQPKEKSTEEEEEDEEELLPADHSPFIGEDIDEPEPAVPPTFDDEGEAEEGEEEEEDEDKI